MSTSSPDESQLAQLQSLPPDAPVAALNMFQFNDQAQYAPGDPEYGTPDADVTGQEAFARYSESAGAYLTSIGGRVVFSTPVDQVMIGPNDPKWDLIAIMYFPTRKAFMGMLTDPEFQATSRHRKAALATHHMIHLAGDPFTE